MSKRRWYAVIVACVAAAVIVAGSVVVASAAGGKSDLAKVKGAVAKYHQTEKAQAAGWGLVPGLDHCFDNQPVGGMGYHYINTALLDLELDANRPEALVYHSHHGGKLQLGAVEWIVPAAPWDAANAIPPEILGHDLHLNAALGVYVLHAWIFEKNPAGTFEDWNPNVSCP